MALKKHPLAALANFVPENTFDELVAYLEKYAIKLTIKRDRKSVYGDYRPAQGRQPHRISVNGGLNKYHFLITLVHEIAHLVTFEQYGFKVKAHGPEWKLVFKQLLQVFISKKIFPPDILNALLQSLDNLKASSCSDPGLAVALRNYDAHTDGILIQELPLGSIFSTEKGQEFKLMRKRRTRFEAKEMVSGAIYLFPALYEVKKR